MTALEAGRSFSIAEDEYKRQEGALAAPYNTHWPIIVPGQKPLPHENKSLRRSEDFEDEKKYGLTSNTGGTAIGLQGKNTKEIVAGYDDDGTEVADVSLIGNTAGYRVTTKGGKIDTVSVTRGHSHDGTRRVEVYQGDTQAGRRIGNRVLNIVNKAVYEKIGERKDDQIRLARLRAAPKDTIGPAMASAEFEAQEKKSWKEAALAKLRQ